VCSSVSTAGNSGTSIKKVYINADSNNKTPLASIADNIFTIIFMELGYIYKEIHEKYRQDVFLELDFAIRLEKFNKLCTYDWMLM